MYHTNPIYPTFTFFQPVTILPYDECKSIYEEYKASSDLNQNKAAAWMAFISDKESTPRFISLNSGFSSDPLVHPQGVFIVKRTTPDYVELTNDHYGFVISKAFVRPVDDSVPASPISFDSLLGGV